MLDRPPVNALSMPLIDALLAALARARDDTTVRAVLYEAAGTVEEPYLRAAGLAGAAGEKREIAAIGRPARGVLAL